MNRMNEYQRMMEELDVIVPKLEDTVIRAKKRRRKNRIYRSMVGMAASFVLFAGAVNFSTAVADACSRIPFLKELAEAVTFSRSLTDAVENEYMQEVNLAQKDGDVTAKVEYLIVDQKQVTVFYRLDSDAYSQMRGTPKVFLTDGSNPPPCTYWTNNGDMPSGQLQSFTIDFDQHDVPGSLRIKLDVRDCSILYTENHDDKELENVETEDCEELEYDEKTEKVYIAHFEFLLEFDPLFTASGKEVDVNQTVVLDGQKIIISKVCIYPSHIRIEVLDDTENTAWLKGLDFQIVVDGDEIFEPVSNGVFATGSEGTPAMASFRADSSYFYEAKKIELVISGAEWLKKDAGKAYINLVTGETDGLPMGVEFHSAQKINKGWNLQLKVPYREKDHFYQVLSLKFFDADGKEYECRSRSTFGDYENVGELHFIEELPILVYEEDEVWVEPVYSHVWRAEEDVIVEVDLPEEK